MTQIHLRPGILQEVCDEKSLSRDALARDLGVSSASAFRIDSGRVKPSTQFIAALLDYTGRPFEDLFEVTEPERVA